MERVSERYKRIYHYTTWEGLMGILKTQTLWATHFRFLNDISEVVLLKEKLLECIFPIVREEYQKLIGKHNDIKVEIEKRGGLEAIVLHDSLSIIEAAYYATDEIYVISFCGESEDDYVNKNGLLSQWRGYGAGGGIALVFDTEQLEYLLKKEDECNSYGALFITDVIYSNDKELFKQELFSNLCDFSNYVAHMLSNLRGKVLEAPDASRAFPAFLRSITRYKHHAFREEDEIRIVCNLSPQHEKERKFRLKDRTLIPYIELFDSEDFILPIDKIIIGPHKEKETRALALQVMLRGKDIEINVSDIPYVER